MISLHLSNLRNKKEGQEVLCLACNIMQQFSPKFFLDHSVCIIGHDQGSGSGMVNLDSDMVNYGYLFFVTHFCSILSHLRPKNQVDRSYFRKSLFSKKQYTISRKPSSVMYCRHSFCYLQFQYVAQSLSIITPHGRLRHSSTDEGLICLFILLSKNLLWSKLLCNQFLEHYKILKLNVQQSYDVKGFTIKKYLERWNITSISFFVMDPAISSIRVTVALPYLPVYSNLSYLS